MTTPVTHERRLIFFLEPFFFPAGGQAAIYRHVEILNAHGVPAFIALRKKPRVDFYHSSALVLLYGSGFLPSSLAGSAFRDWQLRRQVRPGDVWVVPEVFPKILRALKSTPAKRLLFCQNHFFLKFTADAHKGIDEFNADKIIASAESIRDFFRDVYHADVPFLQTYMIDPKIFAPAPKKRQIAFMPRKLPQDALFIQAAFKRRYPQYADVPWVSVDGVPQKEAARLMGESEIFLSLSFKDSLGLPPLEAMSCGCLVAGYHGEGGRSFTTQDNGWWADTGDWKACVDGLASALALADQGGSALEARRSAMAHTLERFLPQRVEKEIVEFWKNELVR